MSTSGAGSSRDEDWQAQLQPWAQQYADLTIAMIQHVRSLDQAALNALHALTNQPTDRNCWWAVYDAAKMLHGEVLVEQRRRMTEAVRDV